MHMRRYAAAAALLLAACHASPAARPSPSPSVSPSPVVTTVLPPPVTPTVIGVLGDWGYPDGREADVVRLMSSWNLDAVVTTGDNAYGGGRVDEAAFAKRTIAPLLRSGSVPLYASLGNHDVVTRDGEYVMRDLGIPAHWYARVVGPVQVVVLDANRPSDPAQQTFLRGVLDAPRPVPFRVVVFHQPAWSCSLHDADAGVARSFVPLFRDRVDLVLAGHNHTYERFMAGHVPYVTTGGGGAPLYPSIPGTCRGSGKAAFVKTVYHAVRLTATPDRLLLEAVGLDGRTFDRVEV
jgi:predicted phosphodiesterase